jgi:CheY-like chemotaxis protein
MMASRLLLLDPKRLGSTCAPKCERASLLADSDSSIDSPIPYVRALGIRRKVPFTSETQDETEHESSDQTPWVILIVDDDEDVHDATLLALADERIEGRRLELRHAYSAKEARARLIAERDVHLVLLDVIMESADAGLQLIPFIHDTIGRPEVKIVLRTGHPGPATEDGIREQLAIDGYVGKARLTRKLLLDALTRALRASTDPRGSAQH